MLQRRQVQAGLWAALILFQILVAALLIFGLMMQGKAEPAQSPSFQPSRTYNSILAEKGQLTVEDQRKLLSLTVDLEKMVEAHSRFEASMLNEVRGLYAQLLFFLAITITLQVVLAIFGLRVHGIRTA
jgi:hypothetical protein